MAVTEDDVRHVAALARLGLDAERIPTIAAELNGILAHMEVLSKVDTSLVARGDRRRGGRDAAARRRRQSDSARAPARGVRAGDARRVLPRTATGDARGRRRGVGVTAPALSAAELARRHAAGTTAPTDAVEQAFARAAEVRRRRRTG